jgi:hypothetical protein
VFTRPAEPSLKVWREHPETPFSKFVADVLERVTYKLGWSAHVGRANADADCGHLKPVDVVLRLEHDEWDANDWRKDYPHVAKVATRYFFFADDPPDEVGLSRTLRDLIRSAELHESDEWLRLDGIRIVDPHPELKREPALMEEGPF